MQRRCFVFWFQFHTGSIKRNRCRIKMMPPRGFNSILVRLKGKAGLASMMSNTSCFNSILVRLKATLNAPTALEYAEFQFHTGSIKSQLGSLVHPSTHACFNSILVRLKAMPVCRCSGHQVSFNSILVRLKENTLREGMVVLGRFNSILVRLKGPCKHCTFVFLLCVSIPYWFD